jgi:protein-tyrosine kinase
MERIQSAMAKARAAREGKVQGANAAGKRATAGSASWAEMPEMPLDLDLLDKNRVVAHSPANSSASFDVMRTNLLRVLRTNGWSRVAITSPTAGCGKTTVVLNLAFSLARLADIKVLVVELDLRHPSMTAMLGQVPGQNFAGMLAGPQIDYRQIRRVGDSLALGLTSQAIESPAELLSSARTADIIDEIEARLRPDVILFDMSPMLANDDTIAFLDQVDCALMVAAAEETTVSEVERCGKDLSAHTQVLGVILNKCRYLGPGEDVSYPE